MVKSSRNLSLSSGEAGGKNSRQVSWLRLEPTHRAFPPAFKFKVPGSKFKVGSRNN
jgi:hypothetical protein